MKVCIAEKPSVAREIASVLGANTKHDGYFEGNGYQVTYTFGHLCTLKEPNDYKNHWKSWDLNNLPMLPEKFETKVVDNSGIQKQFKIIKSLFDKADLVINCGDAGQEGELIQRWVMNEANYKGEVKRLWISSLTTEAIKEGFENLKPSANYDNLYYAGFSRAIGDWLLECHAFVHCKTRRIQTSFVHRTGANANTGNGCGSLQGNRKLQTATLLGVANFIPGNTFQL
jgi:DNA topoisomerase-3